MLPQGSRRGPFLTSSQLLVTASNFWHFLGTSWLGDSTLTLCCHVAFSPVGPRSPHLVRILVIESGPTLV